MGRRKPVLPQPCHAGIESGPACRRYVEHFLSSGALGMVCRMPGRLQREQQVRRSRPVEPSAVPAWLTCRGLGPCALARPPASRAWEHALCQKWHCQKCMHVDRLGTQGAAMQACAPRKQGRVRLRAPREQGRMRPRAPRPRAGARSWACRGSTSCTRAAMRWRSRRR